MRPIRICITALALAAPLGVAAQATSTHGDELKLTGTIVERSLVTARDGTPRGRATLRTPEGKLVVLDLGPPGGEGTIAKGDRVVATGVAGRLDGEPVFVVRVIVQQYP